MAWLMILVVYVVTLCMQSVANAMHQVPLFFAPAAGLTLAWVLGSGQKKHIAASGIGFALAQVVYWSPQISSWGILCAFSLSLGASFALGIWVSYEISKWLKSVSNQESVGYVVATLLSTSAVGSLVYPSVSVILIQLLSISSDLTSIQWWIKGYQEMFFGTWMGLLLFMPWFNSSQALKVRRILVSLPLLGLTAVVCISLVLFVKNQIEQQQTYFETLARERVLSVEAELNRQIGVLHSVAAFVSASENVNRTEFELFAKTAQYYRTQNVAVGMARMMPKQKEARQKLVQSIQQEVPDYQLISRDSNNERYATPESENALSIVYIEPIAVNKKALGINILSVEGAKDAALSAYLNTTTRISEPFKLSQDPKGEMGMVMYEGIKPLNSGDSRGVVFATIQLKQLLEPASTSTSFMRKALICMTIKGVEIFNEKKSCVSPGNNSFIYQQTVQFESIPIGFTVHIPKAEILATRLIIFVVITFGWITLSLIGLVWIVLTVQRKQLKNQVALMDSLILGQYPTGGKGQKSREGQLTDGHYEELMARWLCEQRGILAWDNQARIQWISPLLADLWQMQWDGEPDPIETLFLFLPSGVQSQIKSLLSGTNNDILPQLVDLGAHWGPFGQYHYVLEHTGGASGLWVLELKDVSLDISQKML